MKTTSYKAEAHACISYSGLKTLVNIGTGRKVSPSTLSRWMQDLGFPRYDPRQPREYTAQDAAHLVAYGKCLKEAAQKGQKDCKQRALALFLEYTGDSNVYR